jgi:hypothetical protein
MTELVSESSSDRLVEARTARPRAERPFPERVWIPIFLLIQLVWLSALGYGIHWLVAP